MWKERLSALDKRRKRILQAGGQDRIEKQHKSGKLTALSLVMVRSAVRLYLYLLKTLRLSAVPWVSTTL